MSELYNSKTECNIVECPNCLYSCNNAQKFCPRCGAKLSEDAFHIPDASRIFKTEPPLPGQFYKPRGTIIMYVTLVLCILGPTALIGIFLAITGIKKASNPREKNIYRMSLVFSVINITLLVMLLISK
jgi:hypothetical protein